MRWTLAVRRLNTCEITWQVPSTTDQDEASSQSPEMVLVSQSQATALGSPHGHVRSHSDVTQTDDLKQAQHADKKTVRTILSHLLPASSAMAPIQVCLHVFGLWGDWWHVRKCEFCKLRGNSFHLFYTILFSSYPTGVKELWKCIGSKIAIENIYVNVRNNKN